MLAALLVISAASAPRRVSSSGHLLVLQCGGTNDRFGRLDVDVLPRLQATIDLAAAATTTRHRVSVLTSGGLNETLHLGIARGPGTERTRPHWRLVADALLESGLPSAALVDEGIPALTTVDEALMTRDYVAAEEGRFTEVAVVTSAYHAARVEHLFGRALAPCAGVRIQLRVVAVPEQRLVVEPSASSSSSTTSSSHKKLSLLDDQSINMRRAHEASALKQLREAPNGKWLTFLKRHGGLGCTALAPAGQHEHHHHHRRSTHRAAASAGGKTEAAGGGGGAPSPEALARGQWGALAFVLCACFLLPLSVAVSLLCRRLGLVYRPPPPHSGGGGSCVNDGGGGSLRRMLFAAGIVCAFIGLNSALSLLNRWALGVVGGLHLPLLMTASHMIFGASFLAPLMLLHEGYAATLVAEARGRVKALCLIGSMNALQIALNNASLVSIELSLNQVVRATGPVVTSLLLVCLEGTVPSRAEALCLLLISGGAGTTIYSGFGGSTAKGVLLTATSTLAQCLQISVSGRIMRGHAKLDAFQMTALTGPVAFLALLPFALASELGVLSAALATQPATALGFLLGSCLLAVAYNVTLFQALATLSTVGTAILGNVKIVLLLFLSALFLGELRTWSTAQLVGFALTFVASACFSHLKLQK